MFLKQSETTTVEEEHKGIQALPENDDTKDLPKQLRAKSFENEFKKKSKRKIITKYNPKKILQEKTGYTVKSKISNTLQGSVYTAVNSKGDKCVVKRATVELVNKKVAVIDKKLYRVEEDIIKEANNMKYLTNKNPPKGLPKYISFFNDKKNYFLLMEHGGESLLNYASDMHKRIKIGELSITEWKRHVRVLVKQMFIFINWLHYKTKTAHLDISLENMCIKGYKYINGKFILDGQIYFIDYGLCEQFNNDKLAEKCEKYVGKTQYMSPKVFNAEIFNAYKNDIWSLGVVLFALMFSGMPYKKPNMNDPMFNIVIDGGYNGIYKWAEHYNRENYIDKPLLKIMLKMLCYEDQRWTMKDLIKYVH